MKITTILGLFFVSVFAVSCATSLTESGKKVKLSKEEPKGCKELGDVSGEDSWSGNVERSRGNLRNKAADMGANYVVLDTISGPRSTVVGRAFKCPEPTEK